MFNRIHLIVLDSVGIGAQHDAKNFGDEGAHTLKHTLESHPVTLPNMESFGLGCIDALPGVACTDNPAAFYSRMSEVSQGKDTMTGHWEIAGLNIEEPFKVYPDGFPEALLDKIREVSGRGIDRKSTRLNSSHVAISYAVFCVKKKTQKEKFIACHSDSKTRRKLRTAR